MDSGTRRDASMRMDATMPDDGGEQPDGEQPRDGGQDAGAMDGGDQDSGLADAGGMDGGATDGGALDGGGTDGGQNMDGGSAGDGGTDGGTQSPSEALAELRGLADGEVSVQVGGAVVTYVRPAVGSAPAGFFVQAETEGPALAIEVDPSTLSPVPEVGDTVSFEVTEMTTLDELRAASAVSGWTVTDSGFDVQTLRQDISSATDVVSDIASYESELIRITGTIASSFGFAGTGYQSAQLDTAGVSGNPDLEIRMPETLVQDLRDMFQLEPGCEITTDGPFWRFNQTAQPEAFFLEDVTVETCGAPRVTGAMATSNTEVVLTFDRKIDPASVSSDGSQFTISGDGGLAVSGASVSNNQVTLTTATQTEDAAYTVTVDSSVTDLVGTGVDSDNNSAEFTGFPTGLGIAGVSPSVLVHGAQITVRGSQLDSVSDVRVGGTSQPFTIDGSNQLTIDGVDDTTPTGSVDLVVDDGSGATDSVSVSVARVVLNEVDADQDGVDSAEFIELDADGRAGVDLTGYTLVLFNGNDNESYQAIDLAASTDGEGRLVVAPDGSSVTGDITYSGSIQNGADAVVLTQGAASTYNSTPVSELSVVIDALVYDTSDSDADTLLDVLLGTGEQRVQVNEDATDSETESAQRCGTARRDGRVWETAAPTPDAANNCA
jgi:hypothetical protein